MNLRDVMQGIYDEHGAVTKEIVLEVARDPEHPLHNRFNWDDTSAAESWRLHQASKLIRSIRIRYAEDRRGPKHIRAYVSTVRGSEPTRVYAPTEEVVSDEFGYQLLIREMERDIAALKRKYSHLKEFTAAILAAIEGETA